MTQTTDSSQSASYVWTFPGSPVEIAIGLDVVAAIRKELDAAGDETGGLLLGDRDTPGVTKIRGYKSLPPGGPGPAPYLLCGGDPQQAEKVLVECGRGRSGFEPVGYYRTDLSGQFRLRDDELRLIRECFADPSNVFLLVAPQDGRAANAAFFFWDNGEINVDFSFMEFPFDPEKLAQATATRRSRLETPPPPAAGQPREASRARRRLRRVVLAILLVAVVASIGALIRSLLQDQASAPPAPAKAAAMPSVSTPSMRLTAERVGNALRISWDRSAPAVAGARVGLLSIADGTLNEEVSLNPAQLKSGSLMYWQQSARIELQLEVFRVDGKSDRESLVVVLGPPPAPAEAQVPPKPGAQPVSTPAPVMNPRPVASRPFQAPPGQPAARESPVVPAPPSIAPGTALADSTVAQVIPRAAAAPPVIRPEPSQAELPSSLPAAAAVKPVAPPRAAFVPAQPVRRPPPVIPMSLRSWLSQDVEVDVSVAVDEAGRVVSVEPLNTQPGALGLFGELAASTVRQWQFQPARDGDKNVASRVMLKFRFRRQR